MLTDTLHERLCAIVGSRHVLDDPALRDRFERDITGRYGAPATLVVRPGSTGEVADVLRVCDETRTPVVPQGGNTGLVGGGVPRGGEILLSLSRLDELGPVDELAGQVTAGAGVTLEAVQAHASAAGLAFGVDHGARSGATIGGMVSTDAGGAQVLRYGTMRAQVVGVEAVLPSGRVVRRLAGLLKDTAGYDVSQLLVGTEGTLGIVTAARLRLVPRLQQAVTALVAVPSMEAAVRLMRDLRARATSLNAVEVFFAEGMRLVCEHRRLAPPFTEDHPVYVLAECSDHDDPLDDLAGAIEDTLVLDVAVADDTARRRALWAYRDFLNEAVAAAGVPHKLDVTLPLAALAEFEHRVRDVIEQAAPAARTILWGHLGDGNIHVNVLGPDAQDERCDDAVLRLVAELDGSISAEHGVGVSKRRWLSLTRSEAEILTMRALKHTFDPHGILNPGAVLPDAA
ncbi:FAD-binding oxidoreductase [Candidatus Solirubrobacter pratensis]|uniref:FAD-binding oxidoreductase n=1 Tax=Candidatus Solirubrobacter pratensis TaxID=1298857 RepID=UPI0004182165|nr:FAD-binding oxidoreductase [Candidatus Solirubrobacter pratensis]